MMWLKTFCQVGAAPIPFVAFDVTVSYLLIYKDCPLTWKRLKQQILGQEQNRQDIIRKLKDALTLS
jgi:hypothetical protein